MDSCNLEEKKKDFIHLKCVFHFYFSILFIVLSFINFYFI